MIDGTTMPSPIEHGTEEEVFTNRPTRCRLTQTRSLGTNRPLSHPQNANEKEHITGDVEQRSTAEAAENPLQQAQYRHFSYNHGHPSPTLLRSPAPVVELEGEMRIADRGSGGGVHGFILIARSGASESYHQSDAGAIRTVGTALADLGPPPVRVQEEVCNPHVAWRLLLSSTSRDPEYLTSSPTTSMPTSQYLSTAGDSSKQEATDAILQDLLAQFQVVLPQTPERIATATNFPHQTFKAEAAQDLATQNEAIKELRRTVDSLWESLRMALDEGEESKGMIEALDRKELREAKAELAKTQKEMSEMKDTLKTTTDKLISTENDLLTTREILNTTTESLWVKPWCRINPSLYASSRTASSSPLEQ